MRIIFLGSPEYAVYPLKWLHESSEHELVGVVSQTPKKKGRGMKVLASPVSLYAVENKIPLLTPEKASNEDFLKELKALKPDLCITCAYGKILTKKFLEIPSRGTINIHPSELPFYRGAVPVPAALLDGLTKTSVTVLFTVKALDAGHLITQESFDIAPEETADELLTRLFKASTSALKKSLEKLEDPDFIGDPQDESKVTHCTKISKEDGLVQWKNSSSKIFNAYRAYCPWPGSFTFYEGKRVILDKMSFLKESFPQDELIKSEGQFYFLKERKVLRVKTQDSFINILSLRPEGKKLIGASDFWNQIPKAKRQESLFSA